MSALVDISAVVALENKAATLLAQGGYVRAAEKYATACTAAQALGQTDCLVLVSLQLRQADCWFAQQTVAGGTPEEHAAMRRTAFALLAAVMPPLQRRKAARTLLPGGCRAHEEAFDAAQRLHIAPRLTDADADPSRFAPLLGCNCFLSAGKLAFVRCVYFPPPEAALLAAHVSFFCDALELMAQPRNFDARSWTDAESVLTGQVQHEVEARHIRADNEHGARMLAAWARLQRSGVLEQRGIAHGVNSMVRGQRAAEAAGTAAAAAKGLHACGLVSCAARELNAGQHKKCSACRTVGYCTAAKSTRWRTGRGTRRRARRRAQPQHSAVDASSCTVCLLAAAQLRRAWCYGTIVMLRQLPMSRARTPSLS
jgi:hypothetical protein